jgi:subtilisin family serine protease
MKRFILLLICSFTLSCVILSQNSGLINYNKLDGRLNILIQVQNQNPKLQKFSGIASEITDQNKIGVIIKTSDPSEITNNGITINSSYKGFVTARVTIDELAKLSNLTNVTQILKGQELYPLNDVAGGIIGSKLLNAGFVNGIQYTGTGVILLDIDTGIDWSHLDFRDPVVPTKSRILYIWDQTLTAAGSEKTPQGRDATNYSGLNYGVEYGQSDINSELGGSPPNFVREHDTNGHGSHTAGSAAGNGASMTNIKYAGIAPQADIVIVKAGNGSFPNTNIIDGLTYAAKISAQFGKPVVVNMSLGGQEDPHDGTSDLDKAVDQFASGGNGRAVVIAAGNDGGNKIHFTSTINASATSNITFSIPTYTANAGASNDYCDLDIWSSTNGSINATATSPNSFTATQNTDSQGTTTTNDGAIYIYNFNSTSNNNREVFFEVYDAIAANPPARGTWTLSLTNTSASPITYHGWIVSSVGASVTGGNSQYTVASPGTATDAITIGAFVTRWRWKSIDGGSYRYTGTETSDNIASFSSIGPRRDGVQKPDVAAPGQAVISVKSSSISVASSNITPDGLHMVDQGTSMATPIAAGSAALLLQQSPSLTYSQVKSYITANADADSYVGTAPNYTWGYGKLDVFRSMINLTNLSWPNFYSVLSYDLWNSVSGRPFNSNDKFAVRFTPTISGEVSAAFLHLYLTSGITSPLNFEIWSDNAGLPNAKLGSTVSFDQNSLLSHSWNYIDIRGTGVNVTAGTDYHIVGYFTSGSSTSIGLNTGVADNRSSYNTGSGWSPLTTDLKIRTLITPNQSVLPVELFAFNAALLKDKIQINWKTATEKNNYGFEIERKEQNSTSGIWSNIGFVRGNGNSNIVNKYSFIDLPQGGTNFTFRLKQIDIDGSYQYSNPLDVSLTVPESFTLKQNFPNPFNPSTSISYQLSAASYVTLKVFDVLGREVATLVNGKKEAGNYELKFNASNLSSGIYYYTLQAGTFKQTNKLVLLK